MATAAQVLFPWMFVCLFAQGFVSHTDIPCATRVGDSGQGYICVCNASYCDTVRSPTPLARSSFYHYKTSNSSPGFSHYVGNFLNSSDIHVYDELFTINSSVEYQEIIGFGGGVTDTSAIVVNYLPSQAADQLIESYFGANGIEYSMLRLPIGGTDFSPRSYTLDDVFDDVTLQNFSLSYEDYSLKIPAIKRAMTKSTREIKLLACTWVTPAWMKTGDTSYTGFLKENYQRAWAEYHIKFLKSYQKEGLDIWSLSGNNEAVLQFVYPLQQGMLNSTLMLAAQQRRWLKTQLKPLLVANNFSHVKFFGLEDERAFAPWWMNRFARDPEAYKALDGLALHWYSDFFISVDAMDKMHEKHPEKLVLYTESSINAEFGRCDYVSLGNWTRAELYIYYIMENLDHWTSAWLDWNLALDENGGPSLTLGLDAAVIVNRTSGEFYKQPMFYAMGHFSKFMPPGSKRVQVKPSLYSDTIDDADKIEVARSFMRRRASQQTSLGNGDLPLIKVPQAVRSLATSNPGGSFTVVVANTRNRTARVKIEDSRVGVIVVDIEQHSINSFIYWP